MRRQFSIACLALITMVAVAQLPGGAVTVNTQTVLHKGSRQMAEQLQSAAEKNAALQIQNQHLSTDEATLQGELNTDQQNMLAQTQQLTLAARDNQFLQQQVNALRIANAQLRSRLSVMQQQRQVNATHAARVHAELPSLKTSLLRQSHRSVACAHRGDCTFQRQLPLRDEDKLTPEEVHATLHSRYFMPVTLTILVLIVLGLLILFIYTWGLHRKGKKMVSEISRREEDFQAVAGDNVVDTKLDMARALIEMGEEKAAREALKEVLAHGDQAQRQSAKRLLEKLDQ